MRSTFGKISSLLLSVFVLLIGHGLQLALIPLRAELDGWPTGLISVMGSSYFAGFLLGCMSVPRLVSAVGHVRTFTVLTAVGASALLAIALTDDPLFWLLFRAGTGWAISGLYLVIESWLNEASESAQRGTILSIYSVLVLLAIVVGQQLLPLHHPQSSNIVIVGTLFIVLAAVPVGLTRSPVPQPVPAFRFALRELFATSQAATLSTLCAGLITGAFWTLVPALLSQAQLTQSNVGLLLSATITGGAISQLPFGRLSDYIDRRIVLSLLMLTGAAACWWLSERVTPGEVGGQMLIMALIGAFAMPVYSIALAHANDNTGSDFLRTGTSMLMVNTLGSMLGPVLLTSIVGAFLHRTPQLLDFYRFAAGNFLLGGLIAIVMVTIRRAPRKYFEAYEASARSTQGAIALDPRSDEHPEP